jgi:diphthine synthase
MDALAELTCCSLSPSPKTAITEETLCVGLARVGAEDQKIAAGTLQQMCTVSLGEPLHSLVITGGNLHPLEMEMLSLFSIPESQSTDGL